MASASNTLDDKGSLEGKGGVEFFSLVRKRNYWSISKGENRH